MLSSKAKRNDLLEGKKNSLERRATKEENIPSVLNTDSDNSEDRDSKMSSLHKYGVPKFLEDIYLLSGKYGAKVLQSENESLQTSHNKIQNNEVKRKKTLPERKEHENIDSSRKRVVEISSDTSSGGLKGSKRRYSISELRNKLQFIRKQSDNSKTVQEEVSPVNTNSPERKKSLFNQLKTGLLETGSGIFTTIGKINLRSMFTRTNTDRNKLMSQKEYELLNDKSDYVNKKEIKARKEQKEKLTRQSTKLRKLLQKHAIIREDLNRELVKRLLKRIEDKKKSKAAKFKGNLLFIINIMV